MRRVLVALSMLILAALACISGGTPEPATSSPTQEPAVQSVVEQPTPTPRSETPPTELSPDQVDSIMQAAVQIIAARGTIGNLEPLWGGSGTITTPTGEIITNCHVACGAPYLVILMTTNSDEPPEPRYLAEVTHFHEDLDLAILQIVTDIDGNPVSPTDLPYLPIGNSDTLRLAEPIRVFGYPSVGGSTITFTSGSVSGFESAAVGGDSQRVIIKTDADIAGGNSGGTAVNLYGELIGIPTWVNPDVREGVTIGGISVLRPVNLVTYVRQSSGGTPPTLDEASLPPSTDADPYEPNDDYDTATGPLAPGDVINGYISWDDDLDVYYITTSTLQPIQIRLTNIPAGTDYDLYLLDGEEIVTFSESESPEELIEYSPPAAGNYWIVVASYSGSSETEPYTLSVNYDGGSSSGSSGGSKAAGDIQITGQVVDGNTGRPLSGGTFGLLNPGVTCSAFFDAPELDLNLVTASSETNAKGFFTLVGVPTNNVYSAFFITDFDYVCENKWLEVPSGSADFDLGQIDITFN